MPFCLRVALCIASCLLPVCASAADADSSAVTYDQIRPVLRKHCVGCHNSERPRGDLDLSSFDAIKAGSSSGPVAIERRPEESLLYTVTAHLEEPAMPPNSPKIPQREIDLLRKWIELGMPRSSGNAPISPEKMRSANAPAQPANQSAFVAPESLPRPVPAPTLAASSTSALVAVPGLRQILLFSADDHQLLHALPFPQGDVFSLKFSSDGQQLIAAGGEGGQSGQVVSFDVTSGQRIFEIGDETDVVLAADASADGSLVALGGPGRAVKLFRTSDGREQVVLRKHTDWILSVAFSPDGLLLASADRFGGLQVWEVEGVKEFFSLRGHTGPVTALAWHPNSQQLFSAGADGTIRGWDLHTGTQLIEWKAHDRGVLDLHFAGDGRLLSVGRDRQLKIWQLNGTLDKDIPLAHDSVRSAVAQNGRIAVVADVTGVVSTVDLTNGRVTGTLPLPVDPLKIRKPAEMQTPSAPVAAELTAARKEVRRLTAAVEETRAILSAAEAAAAAAESAAARLRGVLARQAAEARQAVERIERLESNATAVHQ